MSCEVVNGRFTGRFAASAATPLISTIVAGLVLAFVFGVLAQRVKVPPLVGYRLAWRALPIPACPSSRARIPRPRARTFSGTVQPQ
jgi:hypothetical protein